MVATKRIVPRLHLLNPQEISDLFITVTSVQRAVEEMHNCTSSTIVVQDGPDAGQTIPVCIEFISVYVLSNVVYSVYRLS